MFSGMTLAVGGVLGHYSKTLLLFFIPQMINYIYSVPQICRWCGRTCPRHRMPYFNIKTLKLESIPSNMNLMNLFLYYLGPMTEKTLVVVLLLFQTICCAGGLIVRYKFENLLY